jgi:hypothetical protein
MALIFHGGQRRLNPPVLSAKIKAPLDWRFFTLGKTYLLVSSFFHSGAESGTGTLLVFPPEPM